VHQSFRKKYGISIFCGFVGDQDPGKPGWALPRRRRGPGATLRRIRHWDAFYSAECVGLAGPSGLLRLRQLEEESRKLKQIVADLSRDKAMLRAAVARKSEASHRRVRARRFGRSQRHARSSRR
jgi:hypothetical protein